MVNPRGSSLSPCHAKIQKTYALNRDASGALAHGRAVPPGDGVQGAEDGFRTVYDDGRDAPAGVARKMGRTEHTCGDAPSTRDATNSRRAATQNRACRGTAGSRGVCVAVRKKALSKGSSS